MDGPAILARTMSVPSVVDEHGNTWQYHSRSDRHSKVACWVTMFDLLQHCALLRRHVAEGTVAFGVNHEFSDFRTRCGFRAIPYTRSDRIRTPIPTFSYTR